MNDNIDSNKKDFDKDNNEDNHDIHDIEPIASDQDKSDKEDDEKYEIKTGNEEIDELLNHLPKQQKEMILKTSTMSLLNMSASNHIENPIVKKITEEHISNFLDASKQNMELDYKEKKHNKIFVGLIILAVMIFIVVLILLLKDTPELMEKIIYTFVGLITGIIGGYGVGKNKGDD